MDLLEFFKSCYRYLRNPNKTLTVVLNIVAIILIFKKSLLGDFSLKSFYKENSLYILNNISEFMIQSYFQIISALYGNGLLLIIFIIVIFFIMALKNHKFIEKYRKNIISAFLRLLKIYIRISREVFLLIIMYAMIFWGKDFIGGLLNFNKIEKTYFYNDLPLSQKLPQVVNDDFITENALKYIYILMGINLLLSLAYIVYRLIRENKMLELE